MSTVPEPVLGPTGYVEPSEADVLVAVLNDINTAFGGGLNATSPAALSTPQGQLASSLAAIITDKNDLFLNFVNQVDPLYAQGSMQDALGLLYFMTRFPATATSGPCLCTGLPGTVIAPNAQAQDTTGNIYLCQDGGTIPPTGSITLTFACQTTGPIACPAGTLTRIYVAVPGWSGITNPADLLEGTLVESSQDFELRRRASVAANSIGEVQAVRAAVISSGADLPVPNTPTSVLVTENYTNATTSVGGVPLVPHSLYVAVLGGDPQAIAQAILSKKSLGCDYNGNTTVDVTDTSTPGNPVYAVTYMVPSEVVLYVAVTLKNNTLLPPNIVDLVRNAITALFATPNNVYGQIGADLYASQLYGAVSGCAVGVQIISLLVGVAASPSDIIVNANIAQYINLPMDGSTISVGLGMINVSQTFISQYANSPRLQQLVADWNVDVDPRVNLQDFYDNVWNLNTAVGYGLDMWGRRVGVTRVVSIPSFAAVYFGFSESGDHTYQPFNQAPFWPDGPFLDNLTLDDDSFRVLIFTKAMSNISNCSALDVNKLLVKLYGGRGNCYAIEKFNMEMEYYFGFPLTPTDLAILQNSGALNRPAGVQAFVSAIDPLTCFGFAGSGYQPFGQGTFQSVKTVNVLS